jgi:hypothetical protein
MAQQYRPIASKPVAPEEQTYMHTPIIQQAVSKMQEEPEKKEYEVGRVILTILRKYFTLEDNWAITPEFRVPEKKRPDFCLEKFTPDEDIKFRPKIFVEIKSVIGDKIQKATDQVTEALPVTLDELGGEFDCFLIVVRGAKLAFYEYHNDRNNLTEDGIKHYHGAIPFNHPQVKPLPAGRPSYSGHGDFQYRDEYKDDVAKEQFGMGYIIGLTEHDNIIQEVLRWMSANSPIVYN